MFATVAKDGYLFLYIMPSFSLVRAIKLSCKVHNKRKRHENDEKSKENNKEENNEK